MDLFDRTPAPAKAAKAAKRDERTTPCPLCRVPVEGIDPMRTCERCRQGGAPARVAWEVAKPKDSATSGEQVLVLANAHLSETAVHVPKDEVGSFERPLPSESSITVGPHPAQLKLGEAA